jgi:hypothetical protein
MVKNCNTHKTEEDMRLFFKEDSSSIEIYKQLLDYLLSGLKREKDVYHAIYHLVDGNTVKIVTHDVITAEDVKELCAFISQGRISEEICGDFRIVAVYCRLSNNKSTREKIIKTLEKIAQTTIFYESVKNSWGSRCIYKMIIDTEKNTVTAAFNADFFKACQEKALTLQAV